MSFHHIILTLMTEQTSWIKKYKPWLEESNPCGAQERNAVYINKGKIKPCTRKRPPVRERGNRYMVIKTSLV